MSKLFLQLSWREHAPRGTHLSPGRFALHGEKEPPEALNTSCGKSEFPISGTKSAAMVEVAWAASVTRNSEALKAHVRRVCHRIGAGTDEDDQRHRRCASEDAGALTLAVAWRSYEESLQF